MVQNKGDCIKELKFMNCPEPMFVLEFLSNTFLLFVITLKVFLKKSRTFYNNSRTSRFYTCSNNVLVHF